MTKASMTDIAMAKTMMGKMIMIQDGEFQSFNGKA